MRRWPRVARPAGEQRLTWRAEGMASGVYLARLEEPGVASAEKLVLLR